MKKVTGLLLTLPLLFVACGQEDEADEPTPTNQTPTATASAPVVDESSSPQYLTTVTDEKGNIITARYGNEVFEGEDKDVIDYELKNKDTNVVEIQTLEGDDSSESSTASYFVPSYTPCYTFYRVGPTYYWRPYASYRGYAYPYRPYSRSYFYNGYYVRRYYR